MVLLLLGLGLRDALTAPSAWVWCEPLGVVVMGVGLMWWRHPPLLVLGPVLIAVGGGVALAYRWGALPRRGRVARYRLPPL